MPPVPACTSSLYINFFKGISDLFTLSLLQIMYIEKVLYLMKKKQTKHVFCLIYTVCVINMMGDISRTVGINSQILYSSPQ